MSAPIHSELADELDISDAKAKKLLGAMLREIRKRARSRGVRLPELGKFKEINGELTFEPSESLARAVNHRFEGLGSEDLASAPDQPDEEEDDSDDGPSTITLGYQESSNWSPIDAEEEDSADAQDEDDEPDTAEFEVPSAEEAADTDEFQAADESREAPASDPSDPPASGSTEPAREPSASGDEESDPTQTEELYPLVDDMSDGSEETSASSSTPDSSGDDENYDRERDTLSDIWESEDGDSDSETEETSTFESETESTSSPSEFEDSEFEGTDPFGESDDSTEEPAETEYLERKPVAGPEASSAPSNAAPAEAGEPSSEEPVSETPSPEDPSNATKEKSTTLRVFTTLLILILIGGGTWYILGQQGIVPQPRTTYTQLRSEIAPLLRSGESGPSTASTPAEEGSPPSSSASTGQESSDTAPASDETESSPSASTSEASASSPSAAASGSDSPGIDQSAGGWTIVVASRTQQSGAEAVVNDFRQRFSGQQVAVDVLSGNVENTTRYRVGVGQFESRADAQQFLDENGAELPDGAWPLRLQ